MKWKKQSSNMTLMVWGFNESRSKVVISGTVHWFDLKTSFHPLLWTSSGLRGTWKLSAYTGLGSLRSAKSVKTKSN